MTGYRFVGGRMNTKALSAILALGCVLALATGHAQQPPTHAVDENGAPIFRGGTSTPGK